MREISPALSLTAEQFLQLKPDEAKKIAYKIRSEKASNQRPKPSSTLIDKSNLLTRENRILIVDRIAGLVDENLFGRSEMCIQFAELMQLSLSFFNLPARAVAGYAIYYQDEKEIFRWEHVWVRVNNEVIDANVDSLYENPEVPPIVKVKAYWGPITETPSDRKLLEVPQLNLPPDPDVEKIWWPELKEWLKAL